MEDGVIMAGKEIISKEFLLETAFRMLKEEGIENITARKLAVKAGCSTQPIFRLYSSMEELEQELFEKTMTYFEEYYCNAGLYDKTPFVNLGMTCIQFAKEEKNLFRILFFSQNRYGKNLYEILNGKTGIVECEYIKARNEGCKNPEELFMKMWFFIYGSAGMTISGDYDLDLEDTIDLLKSAYKGFRSLER